MNDTPLHSSHSILEVYQYNRQYWPVPFGKIVLLDSALYGDPCKTPSVFGGRFCRTKAWLSQNQPDARPETISQRFDGSYRAFKPSKWRTVCTGGSLCSLPMQYIMWASSISNSSYSLDSRLAKSLQASRRSSAAVLSTTKEWSTEVVESSLTWGKRLY